jgi:hypothetical protein
MADVDDDLVRLERDGWAALLDGTAAAFYGERLAADALLVVPGAVMPGADWLRSLDGPQWATFAMSDERVVPLGADAAAVVYRADATRPGDPPYTALVTSTYVRAGTGWELALHQQTPLP